MSGAGSRRWVVLLVVAAILAIGREQALRSDLRRLEARLETDD
ncbi:MAG: hypothetical protein AAGD18_19260 [Actinomycetota bacterium]